MNKKYKKEVNQEYSFFCFLQNRGFVLADFRLGTTMVTGFRMERYISATEIFHAVPSSGSYKNVMLMILGDKKGNLVTISVRDGKYEHLFQGGMHNSLISVVRFAQFDAVSNSVKYATGSYDRFIKVFKVKNISNFGRKNISHLISFKHKFRIMDIDWDPFDDDRLLNTCQKHATVQVWSVSGKKKAEAVVEGKGSEKKKSKAGEMMVVFGDMMVIEGSDWVYVMGVE